MCVILRGRKKAKGVQEKMNGNGGSKGSERSKEKLSELFSLSLSLCFTDTESSAPEVIQEQLAHATQRHRGRITESAILSLSFSLHSAVLFHFQRWSKRRVHTRITTQHNPTNCCFVFILTVSENEDENVLPTTNETHPYIGSASSFSLPSFLLMTTITFV